MYRYLTKLFFVVVVAMVLLANPAASAQDITKCVGYQQTIISSTGLVISTCNWDLEDAPINKAAAGLEAAVATGIQECPCGFNQIPVREFSKYGIKNIECAVDDTPTTALVAGGKSGNSIVFTATEDLKVMNQGSCRIFLAKGKLKTNTNISGFPDSVAAQCSLDVLNYAQNSLMLVCDVGKSN